MFQAWLVQRVVREVLPLVVDTVRAQLRSRQQAPAGEAASAISPEAEARFNALHDDLRSLERNLRHAQEGLGAKLDRLALWNRVLALSSAVLLVLMLYLLVRR